MVKQDLSRKDSVAKREHEVAGVSKKRRVPVRALFVDVGGVLLTNGWDHLARKRAARNFHLNWPEMDERHRLVFETHEEGRLSFEEYLNWVVFHEKRIFTRNQFRDFMFAQSKPYRQMIELILQLKRQHKLKIVVVSNESRAVNAHRISAFKLDQLADTFISSCFVHMRKPDASIFRLALDLAQTPADQVAFIDNTAMFVTIAEGLGMRGILHKNHASTRDQLASFGLTTDDSLQPANRDSHFIGRVQMSA
jgi:HAD superfamily hydrolase (TIGR01509 family)